MRDYAYKSVWYYPTSKLHQTVEVEGRCLIFWLYMAYIFVPFVLEEIFKETCSIDFACIVLFV
ncbi:hypothetical protein TS65_08990 [Aneurinibacillus migulanus]|nr:hypothetical protein TS65_08990 [Aneurinibacillus migulanus]